MEGDEYLFYYIQRRFEIVFSRASFYCDYISRPPPTVGHAGQQQQQQSNCVQLRPSTIKRNCVCMLCRRCVLRVCTINVSSAIMSLHYACSSGRTLVKSIFENKFTWFPRCTAQQFAQRSSTSNVVLADTRKLKINEYFNSFFFVLFYAWPPKTTGKSDRPLRKPFVYWTCTFQQDIMILELSTKNEKKYIAE